MNSINELYRLFKNSSGVCIDTRKINPNCIFFALKGANFNGNAFVEQALASGAAYAVIDEEKYNTSAKCILVEDVLQTLQLLAHHYRKTFAIPIIALTGSNGKTTNKELLKVVLSKKYKVHATEGNLNNHIGVPLTLLTIPSDTEIALVEMGANHQKEIEGLCAIAAPTHGFITNVGKAHLEGFGGEAGVKKGKGELYDFLKKSGGYAFVNERDTVLREMVQSCQMMLVVYYGHDQFALEKQAVSPKIQWKIMESEAIYQAHISGDYNFENIQTAYSIGRFFNVPAVAACQALAAYNPTNNRSQEVKVGSNIVFLDAYNANPSSMKAAIENFSRYKTESPKVVILGDMFELGEAAAAEHESLGQLVASANFDTVVLFGENMKHALKHLSKAFYFTDKFSLHNWMLDKGFKNSVIFIKGSRGVALETVLKFIENAPSEPN